MRFCFHSVRHPHSVPLQGWDTDETYIAFRDILTVSPEWFYDWVPRAREVWGNELVITFDDAYRDVLIPACIARQKYRVRTVVFVPTAHIGKAFPRTPYDVMHGSELAFMAGYGVELGSHGHDHRDMRRLPAGLLASHLALSKEILEHLDGVLAGRVFAPPHGYLTPDMASIAYAAGFGSTWGTNIDGAGKIPVTEARALADEHGYVDYEGRSHAWPWEL